MSINLGMNWESFYKENIVELLNIYLERNKELKREYEILNTKGILGECKNNKITINKDIVKYRREIIDYIQLVILYEFQWRFFTDKEKINIDKKEIKKYWNILVKLLKQCDDKNILFLPMANDFKKRKMLEIKYDGYVYNKLILKGNKLLLNDHCV